MGESLFGGSHQSSTSNSVSGNHSYDTLLSSLMPQVNQGTAASSQAGALLGVGGDTAAAQAGLNNYLNSSGYNFQLGQGTQAINNSAAAKGLLNSGATMKALSDYGQNTASTYFNNYLNQLGALTTAGNSAAGTISGAGQYSNSSSTSSGKSKSGALTTLFG